MKRKDRLGIVPTIVIVGETASGKSRLAMQIAQHIDADILCADATTVYRGLDIGSAKPTAAEREEVTHFGLDIAGPDSRFTAADYKAYADAVLQAQVAAGRPTVVVGGSGLYIDSVLYDYSFGEPENLEDADAYEGMDTQQLRALVLERFGQEILEQIDSQNPRRLISLLRRGGLQPTKQPLRADTWVIGLQVERSELERRIEDRVDAMILAGLEEEVRGLAGAVGWGVPAMQAVGYREFREYFEGGRSLAEVRERIVIHTRQLAKKQRTWFGRNPDIAWVSAPEKAVDLVTTILQN